MTPTLSLILMLCVSLAEPAKEEDPSVRAQATLRRVAKLPTEQQRMWLRVVKQRYDWSVLLTMKPEEGKREQERIAQILMQKTVGWAALVDLLRQLDQREKLAISRLVRQYRTQVYETFGKQQQELIDRQEAWYRIWSSWEKAGSPPEQQDQLMDWLADAIKLSVRDTLGVLPPDPKFGDDIPLLSEALVKQLSKPPVKPSKPPPSPPPSRRPEFDLPPPPDLLARGPLLLRVPDGRRSEISKSASSDAIVPRHMESPSSPAFEIVLLPIAVPEIRKFASQVLPDPRQLTAAPPLHPPLVVRAPMVTAVLPPESVATAEAPASNRVSKPQESATDRRPAELPQSHDVAIPDRAIVTVPPAAVPTQPNVPNISSDATPELSGNPRPPREDLVATLPRNLSQSSLPHDQNRPSTRIVTRVERRPLPANVPSAESDPEDQHAHVNVEELAARISGINLSLRTLEGELNEKKDYGADQLDNLLNRLDILVLRQKDLALFRDLIAPQQQTKVGKIDSSRQAVSNMGTRISDLRSKVRDNETLPAVERTATLKHLDDLSDRLATMTTEK